MHGVARALNWVTGGKLHPNVVTMVGLIAYFPIGLYLIPNGYFVAAGICTIIFGLMDTLDGELARLQKRDGPSGMFLDSVTDRMKEILLYVGIAMYWSVNSIPGGLWGADMVAFQVLPLAVAALGVSMLVTYINAWGEVVISRSGNASVKPNAIFRGGAASYEVRIALLAFGLLVAQSIGVVLVLIIVLGVITILDRMWRVLKVLR